MSQLLHNNHTPLVTIQAITKAFNGKKALDGIDTVVPRGQIIGIVGPDGAGKTTLIRLIAGLMEPTEGKIFVDGYDSVLESTEIANIAGYMPQKFGLYEDLTVQQNLDLYADLKGLNAKNRNDEIKKLLSFTALAPFTQRLSGALSGGMKQKLGLACALLRTPKLLLLDEPSVGVDPLSRRELWRMVFELLDSGISVVWSTAYLDEAEKCHSVILLNEGKLLYQGSPEALSKKVEGKTFKLVNIQGSRRLVLEKALSQRDVIDGVIQGSDVRIVLREKIENAIDLENFKDEPSIKVEPTPPRFEDAFVDILGGGPRGSSLLAEKMIPISNKHDIVIDAKNLTKTFGSFVAADEITFQVPRGEIFGLLGPNGAGKSTTFKMLCGLLTPSSGKALVMNFDLQEAPSMARQRIGYMAQKFSLYGDLSVQQNLEFFAGVYNLYGRKRKEVIQQMIDIFNLESYLNVAAGTLPLGFKQRLALSCAVIHSPEVLFLDEPTSGVDPITRREFWTHINGLVEKGITVMITTHFMDEAEYCDRIALVYRGKVIHIASPDNLKILATSENNPSPTLEDAFIKLIEEYDLNHQSER